jgi:hypothetical protein
VYTHAYYKCIYTYDILCIQPCVHIQYAYTHIYTVSSLSIVSVSVN